MTSVYRYIFLIVSLLLIIPGVSALNVDIETPINYSLIPTVNNSQYFDGYSISTLYTYYKSLFDDVYCELTGCTMTGDIDMDGNDITNAGDITADNFIGDGSQLTDVWLTSTAQTGLTGDKTGSFDLETTGTAEFGDTTLNGTLVTENTVWDKYGATSIGSNMILQFLPNLAPVNGVGLQMIQSFDAAASTGIGVFVQHKPSQIYNGGAYAAINGYNIVEGENFTGTNKIAALNFGNFQYFSGLGFGSIPSGNLSMDWLAVDVFGMNAVNAANTLAKDVYAFRGQPVIIGTATDAYGYYFRKSGTNSLISGNEYGYYAEKPTEGSTGNYQVMLNDTGDGTGIWFGGTSGDRIYNDGTNLILNATNGLIYSVTNISATGYNTRTQVNTDRNALESSVLGNDLLNKDGSINHSAYGNCYNPVNVVDRNRPIVEKHIEKSCFEFNGSIVEETCEDILVKTTSYPYTIMQDEVDLVCLMAQEMQISALINQNIDLYDGLTDFNEGIMAENIYTQSKTIKDGINYIDKIKDKNKLKVKENHYSYVENIMGSGYDGLDLEDRIVVLEGAVNALTTELCDKKKNAYSWCSP